MKCQFQPPNIAKIREVNGCWLLMQPGPFLLYTLLYTLEHVWVQTDLGI